MEFENLMKQAYHNLYDLIKCDFIGIACHDNKQKEIGWNYVIGNQNNKCTRITVRYGKGIAGQVIQTGRPMLISSFPSKDMNVINFPILLAEKLVTSFAVPIFKEQTIWGVLLVGYRESHEFSEQEHDQVKICVTQIEHGLRLLS
ncbi:GAF domain-containing protein [Bacillus sp. DJP31]|uniref:GAF domain-containing protein n=1 Tax=Bacillus sp. DJP31 TaxID=3409789 RepID=UPI003BB5C57C